MHYSDCYKLVINIQDKEKQEALKSNLQQLEQEVQQRNFIDFIKQNKDTTKSIGDLQSLFDLGQLLLVQNGIQNILSKLYGDEVKATVEDKKTLKEIIEILKNIQNAAKERATEIEKFGVGYSTFPKLAKKTATHYLPFTQASDPFKGTNFSGYCWGHTHRYGLLVSQGFLASLSIASDQQLYETFKTNWTFTDILFRRVGWYFWVNQEIRIREAIWNALLQLNEHNILNFNFFIDNAGFHSTSLRMVGAGVEYYDNNEGLVRFKNRENAVNFLAAHLLHTARRVPGGTVSFITVYKLPYSNKIDHDIFADLPQTKLEKEPAEPEKEMTVVFPAKLATAINALRDYAFQLDRTNDIKAKIKSNELLWLLKDLVKLSSSEMITPLDKILNNKNHSLMVNRGTGFYFFASGFKSHSTTETLLQVIRDECNCLENSRQNNPL